MKKINKKIFITGGSGFIGKHLLKKLNEYKVQYVCTTSKKKNLSNNFIYLNLKNLKKNNNKNIIKLLKQTFCVVHLAGIAKDENKIFKDLWTVNYKATILLIKLCKIAKVKKFINISSVRAAGRSNVCSDETSLLKPDGVYGETKKKSEDFVYDYGIRNGIDFVNLRLSNVYGSGSIGYIYKLSNFIKKFPYLKLSIIYNKRSFVHVSDVVDAIYKCIFSDLANNQKFIITNNRPISSSDLFNILVNYYGNKTFRIKFPFFLIYFLYYLAIFVNNFNKDYFKDFIKFMSTEYYSSAKIKEVMAWKASVDIKSGIKEMKKNNII
jgi:nucleoside-diphosphate-sugar epimerase